MLAVTPKTLAEVIPILQVAIGPVILISGAGLILLSMTNRMGRVIDRSRELVRDLREADAESRPATASQIEILYRRARVLRLAITLITTSVLLAAVLIIALFLVASLGLELGVVISLIFVACLGTLIASLVAFIQDIHLSLQALTLELKGGDRLRIEE